MKYILQILLILIFFNLNGQEVNDLSKIHLKGSVQSIKVKAYYGHVNNKKVEKGKRQHNWSLDEHKTFNTLGNTDSVYHYYPDTNLLMFKRVYMYDSLNLLTKSTQFFVNSNSNHTYYTNYTISKATIVKLDFFTSSTCQFTTIQKFNEAGLLISETDFNNDSSHYNSKVLSYNSNDQLINELFSKLDGTYNGEFKYSYDIDGNIIVKTFYDKQNHVEIKYDFEYKFDSTKNWIVKIINVTKGAKKHHLGTKTYYLERTIKYF
jgi:hypothetical protein